MTKITEIIPDDLPEWAKKAMDEGQFSRVAISRYEELMDEICRLRSLEDSCSTETEVLAEILLSLNDLCGN